MGCGASAYEESTKPSDIKGETNVDEDPKEPSEASDIEQETQEGDGDTEEPSEASDIEQEMQEGDGDTEEPSEASDIEQETQEGDGDTYIFFYNIVHSIVAQTVADHSDKEQEDGEEEPNVVTLREDNAKLLEAIQEHTRKIETIEQYEQKTSEGVDALKAEVVTLKDVNTKLLEAIQELTRRIETLQQNKQGNSENILILREKNTIMLETVQELTGRIETLDKGKQKTSQRIDKLEAQQIQDNQDITITRSKLETLTKHTKAVESQLEVVKNSNLQEERGAEARINLAVQTLAEERGYDFSTVEGLKKLCKKLVTEIRPIPQEIEKLQKKIEADKTKLNNKREKLEEYLGEINKLTKKRNNKLNKIAIINKRIFELEESAGLTEKPRLEEVISEYFNTNESGQMFDQSLLEAIDPVDPIEKLGVILDQRHTDGGTALHVAADRNHEIMLDGLLNRLNEEQTCQLLNAQDSLGQTVFHRLARKGFYQTFDKLLQKMSSDKRLQTQMIRDSKDETAILTAALSAQTQTVFTVIDSLSIDNLYKLLSSTGGGQQMNFMHRFISDITHPDTCIMIIYKIATKMGFDGWYKLLALTESRGRTPLHLATDSGHVEITKAIEATTETENLVHLWKISDQTRKTPILLACEDHFVLHLEDLAKHLNGEKLFELLKYQYKNQKTLVHILVLANDSDLLKLFMDKMDDEQKHNILQFVDDKGLTPIHTAAYCDHREMLNILLGYLTPESETTYDLLRKTETRFTNMAIHLAAEKGNIEGIKLMLKMLTGERKRALLNQQNCFDWTPHVAAKMHNQMKTAAWLEEAYGESYRTRQ